MQRVMIVTNSLTGGGAERSMNIVSNELTRRGWSVALVPINSSEPDLVNPNCEIFALDRQWRGSILNTLSAYSKFNRVVRSWKPDVLVLNCDLPELFGALLLRKQFIVIVEHINFAWSGRVIFGKIIRNILAMRGGVWVAVSSHLGIWPTGKPPYAVLQNPLTPSIETIEKTAVASHLERLVYIGRLTSLQKRPQFMLEIGAAIGIGVEIIGDGLMRDTLQEEVATKDLRVNFSGQVRDPWSRIQPGDLLIIPSAYEGDGLVVVEGMQKGVPMLLSDIPDFRRFNLPERNYCRTVGDFITRIDEYREELHLLVVPEDIEGPILASRSPEVVGDSWERFLKQIENDPHIPHLKSEL